MATKKTNRSAVNHLATLGVVMDGPKPVRGEDGETRERATMRGNAGERDKSRNLNQKEREAFLEALKEVGMTFLDKLGNKPLTQNRSRQIVKSVANEMDLKVRNAPGNNNTIRFDSAVVDGFTKAMDQKDYAGMMRFLMEATAGDLKAIAETMKVPRKDLPKSWKTAKAKAEAVQKIMGKAVA